MNVITQTEGTVEFWPNHALAPSRTYSNKTLIELHVGDNAQFSIKIIDVEATDKAKRVRKLFSTTTN